MFAGVLDTLLYGDNMLQRPSFKKLDQILDQSMLPIQ